MTTGSLMKVESIAVLEHSAILLTCIKRLEDLKRSPDLLNNVKIGHGQLRLIIQT